ncbi:MAG: response regulator [Planctomycetes bacterium]|nr:response regulator [Planctomycetota bacterium]
MPAADPRSTTSPRDSVDPLELSRTASPPRPEAPTREEPSEVSLWRPSRGHIVVCVDDEVMVLSSLRRLLRGEPYEFRATPDPREAMEWVGEGHVSIFIADQRMPEITGTDLVEIVRARAPQTVRVILTGYPDLETMRQREGRVIRRLITKPWSDEDLKRTLRLLLRECEMNEGAAAGAAPRTPPLEREPGGDRVLLRLRCRGRTTAEVLQPLDDLLARVEAALDGVLVEIDDLAGLEEPFSTLLTELAARVLSSGVRVSVRDPSGVARLFYRQFFGAAAPVDVVPEPIPGTEEGPVP